MSSIQNFTQGIELSAKIPRIKVSEVKVLILKTKWPLYMFNYYT